MSDSRERVNGIIFVKENVSDEGIVYDESDSSKVRSRKAFEKIFERASLEIISHEF
jgi:hypothetical protein